MLVEKGNFDKDDQGWLDEKFGSIGIENHDQLCQKLSTFTIFRISFWMKMMVEWACSISHQKLIIINTFMSKVFQVHVSSFSNVSDWLKQILRQSEAVPRSRFWRCKSMEFLCLFLRHHILGKLVVASWNVGCCLSLVSKEDPVSLLVVRC